MGQFASAPETRQRRGGGGGGRSRIRSISSAREEKRNEAPADFLTVINEWPHERLIEIDGIGPVLATKIVSNRPYKTAQELVDSKVLPPSAIEALQKVG